MYKEIIERFIQAQKEAEAAYAAAASFEREQLMDQPGHTFAVSVRSHYRTASELEGFCISLADGIVNRARREFAPPGGRLVLDDSAEHKRAGLDFHEDLRKGKTPDLDALWCSLQATYGGGGGASLAYQQAAQHLVSSFGLARRKEVERTASAVILRKRTYSEASGGCRRVGYHSQQPTAECLAALATFAGKAGANELARRLNGIGVHSFEYSYRQKLSLPGLDLVFFKELWEFKFSHELAEQLMLFIGEYGAAFMAEHE